MQSRANEVQSSTIDLQGDPRKLEFSTTENSGRAEVLECLIDGLQFLRGETPVAAQRLAKRVLANIIIEHLEASGFTVHRKAPEPAQILDADGAASDRVDKPKLQL